MAKAMLCITFVCYLQMERIITQNSVFSKDRGVRTVYFEFVVGKLGRFMLNLLGLLRVRTMWNPRSMQIFRFMIECTFA